MARFDKITRGVLKKLDDAYLTNATHLEAAVYAGISETTLSAYRKANSAYDKRITAMRGNISFQAKVNMRKAIEGEAEEFDEKGKLIKKSTTNSKWHLEKTSEEYNPRQKHDVEVSGNKSLIDAILARKAEAKKENENSTS